MASWRYYLVCWSRRSTATVVPAATASQARSRARARRKAGYGNLASARQANAADSRLIRKGLWVRRRKDGSSPQFGPAASRTAARRQRSRYRKWL
jgi:hypothetical protein